MVFDTSCLRAKLMSSRDNYGMHSNKRTSDVLQHIVITKTDACTHI